MPAPAAERIVTGREPFTLDLTTTGLTHIAVLKSPHPSARIRSIDASAALAMPGVLAVLTHEDAPAVLFSTGRHQNRLEDPDDTLVLDPVLRFAGQRVAAVVAETIGLAEAACRAIRVDYEVLPAVFDPEAARSRARRCCTGGRTRSPPGSASRAGTSSHRSTASSATWTPPSSRGRGRVGHLANRPGGPRVPRDACDPGWLDAEGRLVLRTSSQVPYLVHGSCAGCSPSTPSASGSSPPASAAASAASRSCSPRTS